MTERELLIDCLERLNRLEFAYMVVAVQQSDLDLNYLRHWAVKLDVQDILQQILYGKLKPKTT